MLFIFIITTTKNNKSCLCGGEPTEHDPPDTYVIVHYHEKGGVFKNFLNSNNAKQRHTDRVSGVFNFNNVRLPNLGKDGNGKVNNNLKKCFTFINKFYGYIATPDVYSQSVRL